MFAVIINVLTAALAQAQNSLVLPLSLGIDAVGARRRALAAGTAQAGVQNLFNLRFLCTVSMGQDNQLVQLVPDTGIDDLWISSSYKSNFSRSYVAKGTPWSLLHLDKTNATGFLSQDTVSLSGTLKVEGQVFAQVTSVEVGDNGDNFDGRLGLKGLTSGTTGSPTYRANMLAKELYSPDIISFHLTKTPSGSTLVLGAPLAGYAPSGVAYFNCPSTVHDTWVVPMRSLWLGGKEWQMNLTARIDTSFSAFVVNASMFQAIYQTLHAAQPGCVLKAEFLIICVQILNLPTLTLTFGSETDQDKTRWTLTPEDYVVESVVEFTVSSLVPEDMVVIGSVFMQNVYTILDNSKLESTVPRIGFAKPVIPVVFKVQMGYGLILPAVFILCLALGFSLVYCKYNRRGHAVGQQPPARGSDDEDRVADASQGVQGPAGAVHLDEERKSRWEQFGSLY
eukprot:gb/GEZN01007944.1/.p1 GENE.gb/GEZN01007944.1/~~gb/GEZN01007944.1/.p1  ORF type:complete len:451 (-),score=40.03 gb/GEZN01007944.1/:66-1418(-)